MIRALINQILKKLVYIKMFDLDLLDTDPSFSKNMDPDPHPLYKVWPSEVRLMLRYIRMNKMQGAPFIFEKRTYFSDPKLMKLLKIFVVIWNNVVINDQEMALSKFQLMLGVYSMVLLLLIFYCVSDAFSLFYFAILCFLL